MFMLIDFPSHLDLREQQMDVITTMLTEVWDEGCPHQFQLDAIYTIVFDSTPAGGAPFLCLVGKTGEGKSLVLKGAATLMRGVSIFIVPLVGLGADQLSSSQRPNHRVFAYHLDEEKGRQGHSLALKLLDLKRVADGAPPDESIIIYASPQAFKANYLWAECLDHLLREDLVSMIAFDEAHTIPVTGHSFRPEFVMMRDTIFQKDTRSGNDIPLVAASASFTKDAQISFL